jgi:hypothetical protein
VRRAAVGALAGGSGLLHTEDALDLSELGVDLLEHPRAPHEHIDAHVIADCHLVDEAAEVPLQLGDATPELIAALLQLADRLVG